MRTGSAWQSLDQSGEVQPGRSKPRQSAASKTELMENFIVRNAVASGD